MLAQPPPTRCRRAVTPLSVPRLHAASLAYVAFGIVALSFILNIILTVTGVLGDILSSNT